MKLATRRQVRVWRQVFARKAGPGWRYTPGSTIVSAESTDALQTETDPVAARPFLAAFRNAFFLLAGVTHLFLRFDSAGRMGRARGVISPSILLMRGGTRYSACPGGQTPEGFLAFASRL